MILVETAEIGDEKIAAQSIAGTDPQLTGKLIMQIWDRKQPI